MKSKTNGMMPIKRYESHSFNLKSDFLTPKMSPQNHTDRLKVLIIDDHRLFADGICTLLKGYDQLILTKYAADILSASQQINDIDSPDLILLSINDNNYKLIKELNQLQLDIPVMIFSSTDSPAAAGLAIENNASGFISKNSSREDILEAILSVLDGNIFISKPKQQVPTASQNTGTEKVTKRQQQVLGLLSQGLLNKQIAWELDISENTVKAHLSDLFRHLHVTNRTAAVKSGYEYGLIM